MARLISLRYKPVAEGKCDQCTWMRTGTPVAVKAGARSHIQDEPEHTIIVRVVHATTYEGRRDG